MKQKIITLSLISLCCLLFSCKKKSHRVSFKEISLDTTKNKHGNLEKASSFTGIGLITLGSGINSATGEICASNVAEDPETVIDSAGGDHGETFSATMLTSLSSLRNSLDMGFDASGSIGIFSASGKAEFLNSTNISTTNDYILVKVKVVSYSKQLKNPGLSNEALDKIIGNQVAFLKFGGDRYVYEQVYGGELYIMFAADSYSKEERNQNSQSMHAAISLFSGGGSRTKVEETLSKIKHLNIFMCRAGSRGFNFNTSTTVDSILAVAGRFHEEVRQHPTLIAIGTKPLSTLKNYPLDYEPNFLSQKNYLNDIVRKVWDIEDIQSVLNYAASTVPGTFPDSIIANAGKLNRELEMRKVNLQRCKSGCELAYRNADCQNCPELNRPIPEFLLRLADSSGTQKTIAPKSDPKK